MTLTITPNFEQLEQGSPSRAEGLDAIRDPLTGSWNGHFMRLALRARLELARCHGGSVFVAYADLDSFRSFNDLWGHRAGDAALQQVSARLQEIRHNDVRVDVTRLGRDEFVIIADSFIGADDSLEDLGVAIVTAVRAPLLIDGQRRELAISVGLTESTADATPDSLLLEARMSLQSRRRRHEGVAHIYDRTSGPTAEYVRALPEALRSGEIHCAFQPTINVRTGEIVHLEALARWSRPCGEVVGPSVFVPCAESFGLAPALTEAVLRSVAELLDDPATPETLRVWVNISACELDLDDFVSHFLAMLDDVRITPSQIGVEITESQAVRDPLRLAADIASLQQQGIHVAIDDFGSGYSPLGYLRMLAPDVVKLDRSLVDGIDGDTVNQRLVAGVVDVLRELAIEVIAEGVERVEEQCWLTDNGVYNVQGFLWCRPVDPSLLDLSPREVADELHLSACA